MPSCQPQRKIHPKIVAQVENHQGPYNGAIKDEKASAVTKDESHIIRIAHV